MELLPAQLTLEQAAERAGVTRSTVWHWTRTGFLPFVTGMDGKAHLIPADALDEALAKIARGEGRGRFRMPGAAWYEAKKWRSNENKQKRMEARRERVLRFKPPRQEPKT